MNVSVTRNLKRGTRTGQMRPIQTSDTIKRNKNKAEHMHRWGGGGEGRETFQSRYESVRGGKR